MRQVADGLGSATATCVLATDGLVATVVQTLLKADLTLLIADLGACEKGGNGAFLATDGLNATVVQGGWVTSLLKADLLLLKHGGIGAAVGQRGNARGRYNLLTIDLFAFLDLIA